MLHYSAFVIFNFDCSWALVLDFSSWMYEELMICNFCRFTICCWIDSSNTKKTKRKTQESDFRSRNSKRHLFDSKWRWFQSTASADDDWLKNRGFQPTKTTKKFHKYNCVQQQGFSQSFSTFLLKQPTSSAKTILSGFHKNITQGA